MSKSIFISLSPLTLILSQSLFCRILAFTAWYTCSLEASHLLKLRKVKGHLWKGMVMLLINNMWCYSRYCSNQLCTPPRMLFVYLWFLGHYQYLLVLSYLAFRWGLDAFLLLLQLLWANFALGIQSRSFQCQCSHVTNFVDKATNLDVHQFPCK